MKSALVVLGAVAGSVFAQGVTDKISPDGLAPEGCEATDDGTFEISIAQVVGASKRGLPQVSSPEPFVVLAACFSVVAISPAWSRDQLGSEPHSLLSAMMPMRRTKN